MKAYLLIAVTSYLLGSIPFGYVLLRTFRGEDVRRTGSGNIGATNVSRRSPALGVLTLVLDAAKGAAAVGLAYVIASRMSGTTATYTQLAFGGLFAVVGHMFPVWLKFRGGKGVATGMGSFVIIAPKGVVAAVCVFIVIVLMFRYVSLGSIVAVGLFPVFAWALHQFGISSMGLALISSASILIIAKHHANIGRLIGGTENRIGTRSA